MVSYIAIDEMRFSAIWWLNVAICCIWWHDTDRMIHSSYKSNILHDN
jgi:hypothetical protein